MNLKQQLQQDTESAMRQGDNDRRDTLRMLLAAIKQEEVDNQVKLDDQGVERIIAKQAKQRKESIADAEKAGRTDLAAQEKTELVIIEEYLPQQLDEQEVRQIASAVIEEMGASGVADMGRVMGRLMPELQGRADGRVASQVVRELLQN